jgi:hypothetical protein
MSRWKSAVVRAVTARSLAALGGARVDLVVHVGDVADIGHAREAPPQQPRQHVEHHHRPGIAQVGEVIDGRPADIHAHMLRIERREGLDAPGQAVVEAEFGGTGHGRSPSVGRG